MPDQEQATTTEATPDFDFDAWLGEQPEHVRKGYEGKTAGLKSALDKERGQREEFGRNLKDALKKAEKGSELEKQLGDVSSQLEQANLRAAFMEGAGRPEIGCTNPRAAYLVAQADNLFTRSGEPDWGAIKAAAPELFGTRKTPPGNAGSGNGSPPAQKMGMNEFIRAAAAGRS